MTTTVLVGIVTMCVGWLVGCLTSQQHASVSQGQTCSDKFTCCHTETEVADRTFYLSQSQYTDTGPTNPSADPITPEPLGQQGGLVKRVMVSAPEVADLVG